MDPVTTALMTCPKCQAPMRTYERGGVMIDQCTDCRGVFLDRGELDRLMDAELGSANRGMNHGSYRERPRSDYRYEDYQGRDRKKRGGFLSDLFD
jgi:Zn-finger nucleic acid-binding protein